MSVIGRRRHADTETAVQPELSATVLAGMDRRAAEASAARLAELERIHADEVATHRQTARDYADLIEALHARSPQEWHVGEPATAGLAYLRHLEDEADRCGIDRRPPWSRDARPADERMFRSLAAELGAEEQFGLPVPVRTAPGAAEDAKDPVSGAAPPAREGGAETSVLAAPAPETVSTEDGVPAQDEPDAEPDCAETGDVA